MMATSSSQLQSMLQNAVQSVQWTYSLFWQICPQQGVLVWRDGYYNGAIKTRKTVQPMEVSADEASLHRSQQLRELYDSLSAGESNQPARRPCAALSPEDLTESEWFYLMCVSFSFSPGMGLPGKAYSKKHFIWLMGANEVESKVFCRAILAKSARIQTVVCIPLLDGVLELGTTQRVKEDTGFIHHVKSFFTEQQQQTKPALSEHSTSNPTTFPEQVHFYSGNTPPSGLVDQDGGTAGEGGEEDDDQEEDEEQEDEYEEDELEPANTPIGAAEATELMQLDISEPIRLGSPEDGSNNMDSDFHLVAGNTADFPRRADSFKAETAISWAHFQDLQHLPGVPSHEELSQEDTHYSQTVTAILEHLSDRNSTFSSIMGCIFHSANSAFTTWPTTTTTTTVPSSSQWLLKTILFTVPFLHTKYQGEAASPKSRDADSSTASRLRKGGGAEEPSGNHVLAERRRREKLNERFIILRSLVPFVTKMDKASILGDTIEYVKQLRKRIQDLEARARQSELSKDTDQKGGTCTGKVLQGRSKRRITRTITEGITVGGGGQAKITGEDEDEDEVVQVEVSIIESDALVELRCPYKEGLLLDLMQTLRELWVEVVSIQSSLNNNGFFLAELRAKVKENIYGRKASILEVKKSIHQIIPRV